MSKKKLLAINLNEFNLNYIIYGAKKYNCKNIKKLLKLKSIKTFSSDKIQDKNLDPWVQSICINSGKKSKEHKIFNLGEKMPTNFLQIWDYLSKKKINSAIWGTMNTNFLDNKFIKIFLPDPWNNQSTVKPKELNNFYKLARSYAQNYTQKSNKINLIYLSNTFFYLFKNGIIFKLLKNFNLFFLIFLKKGLKNYFLFFLFDIISLYIFKNLTKNKDINFSLIFLNSLAHFQHNNWDNKLEEKDYFLFTDLIMEIIFEISKDYNSLILYNGFSQKKIKPEYVLRPIDPKNFFKIYNIDFNNFHSNMTNGAILTFKSNKKLKSQLKKIKKINLYGYKLFETKILNHIQVFCSIQIRSKKDKIKNNSKRNIFYEKKQKILKKEINNDFVKFNQNITFIKTTSQHIPEGQLFYRLINIKKNRIENIQIYKIISNFFNKK